MTTIQKPSICRLVIFTDHDKREHPAVVTSVVHAGTLDNEGAIVNLHVMVDGGGSRWVKNVQHSQEVGDVSTWRWPSR